MGAHGLNLHVMRNGGCYASTNDRELGEIAQARNASINGMVDKIQEIEQILAKERASSYPCPNRIKRMEDILNNLRQTMAHVKQR